MKLLSSIYTFVTENNKSSKHISNEAVRAWYQALLNRYNSLTAANNAVDTKTGIILAAAVALLIFLAQDSQNTNLLVVLAAIILLVCIALCVRNIHVKPTSTEVHTTQQRSDYYDKDDETFYWQLIADLEDSLTKLEQINNTKGKLYTWGVYLFIAGSLLASVGQFISLKIVIQ